jgi:excisionase family DNA binding protein
MGLFDSFKDKPEEQVQTLQENDKLLTVSEACELLKVSDETLRVWEKQKKITAYQLPSHAGNIKTGVGIRNKRYKKSEVLSLLQPIEVGGIK